MPYYRVIPRDLFNEANLLKCFGQLYLNLENAGLADLLEHDDDGEAFDVDQNESSGGIYLRNVRLTVRGEECALERPLNSRRPYPLHLITEDEIIEVFADDGQFSAEMTRFLATDNSNGKD
jgi:hypothetical protein